MFSRDTPSKKSSSLVRSRSFGGLLNSKSLMTSSPALPVLGQNLKSPSQNTPKRSSGSGGLGALSFSRKAKTPKVARPQRALVIFKHVKLGIR